MLKQKLATNIIKFSAPVKEKEFAFYTKRIEGYCPIHKNDLKGKLDGLIRDDELHEGKWLYTDFEEPKEGAIAIDVDLTENVYFAAHYYRFLIRQYFSNCADAIRLNFTKEIEVWLKPNEQPDKRYTLFDRYTIKIQHQRVSDSPELVLSYDGTSKVLTKNILNLNNLPTDDLRWIKYENKLYKYKYLPEHCKQTPQDCYPVLTNKIKPWFGIPSDKPDFSNRYIRYWEKLTKFSNGYLYTKELQNIIPLNKDGFHIVESAQMQQTLPGAKDLLFGNGKISSEPKNDVRKYGPYRTANKENVRFIFIYQKSDRLGVVRTLFHCLNKGLYKQDANGKTQEVFPSISQFIKQPINISEEDGSVSFDNMDTAEEQITKGIKLLPKKQGVQYVAIYISPVNKFVQNDRHRNVYYRVKELMLQESIALQVILKESITNPGFKYYLPNILVAVLAKIGGIPWRLNRAKTNDLVVGIGAFYNIERKTRYVGSTACFNNDGSFEEFDCFGADDTRMLAGAIRRAVSVYVAKNDGVKRLIIHFYKDISQRELQPIQETLHKLNLNIPVIVLTINKTASKELLAFDILNSNLMPASGTILRVGRTEYLLFNNTRYDAYSKVGTKEYLFPIKISFYCDKKEIVDNENTITELMDQVYQFSRMYFKSVSQQNLPVTIKYPELIARMYPYFKNNTLPEFARKSLWFL